MNRKQELAIARMERALKALYDAGIMICGMDSSLLYATNESIEESEVAETTEKNRPYCPVAEVVRSMHEDSGHFSNTQCYQDSGGW